MTEFRTIQFEEVDGTMVVPNYIGTTINCIDLAQPADWENMKPKVVVSYFSEYSSINFFITISDRQIYFETYSKSGTPKPKLIFYAQSIPSGVCKQLFTSFKGDSERVRNSSSSERGLSISDNKKDNFDDPFGGDKFPLTKKEAFWLIKRNIDFVNEASNASIEFQEQLIAPVFYNISRYEKEFSKWQQEYPEINEHKLIY